VVRTLFGTLQLPSPRWWHCPCQPQPRQTFRPLAVLLPERSTPELCYLQAKFAALASYRVAATLLAELLPLGRPLHATAVRRHAQAVADRLDDELGPERPSVIDSCQRVRAALPRPDLPLLVSLDGGYVYSSQQQSRPGRWFEVIAGRATPAAKCFGFVQTYDPNPNGACSTCSSPRGCKPTRPSLSSPTATDPAPTRVNQPAIRRVDRGKGAYVTSPSAHPCAEGDVVQLVWTSSKIVGDSLPRKPFAPM